MNGWMPMLAQAAGDTAGSGNTADAANPAAGDGGAGGSGDMGSTFEQLMQPEYLMELVQQYALPVVWVLLIFAVGYLVAGWAGRATAGAVTRAKIDRTLATFFGKLVRALVLVFVVIMCLGKFGINTASLAAVVAAAGFAVGLAFQGTLGNFSSGVMLLIFRPFKVGDAVNISGVTGKVAEIALFSTIIDTFDNRRFIVPNGSIYGTVIENITYHPTRRVDVNVGTDYPANIDDARKVLQEAANSIEGVLADPAPAVALLELGDSSINWAVRVWANTSDYWAVKDRLTRQIKVSLDEAGIGIPFPQMDVHVEHVNQPGESS